jgi:hypothetical protein
VAVALRRLSHAVGVVAVARFSCAAWHQAVGVVAVARLRCAT